ncbi:hypothetical protein K501DRAFT_331128 [Backusella circina FSU 941]|nr:hypothetical protein K501DRAFT_331128 [Backusella circina FSU 941]
MSKLFNLGSQRPSTIEKRRFTADFDNVDEPSQTKLKDVKMEPVDIVPLSKSPSSSPRQKHKEPIHSISPRQKHKEPIHSSSYYTTHSNTHFPFPSSQPYMFPYDDNRIPQPYFVPNQSQILEIEHQILKQKNVYLEEKVAQLKEALDESNGRNREILNLRMTEPEQELHNLQKLFEEREKMQEKLNVALQEKGHDRIDRPYPIQTENNEIQSGQVEELKSAIKSLEARLLKSESERINNYKKYEMEHMKGLLQSGFTSINILSVEEQARHILYSCSIRGRDGTLHFTLSYPRDESDEAEYTPHLNYKQQTGDFITNLDDTLKCKMCFRRNALPALLQLLLEQIPNQEE